MKYVDVTINYTCVLRLQYTGAPRPSEKQNNGFDVLEFADPLSLAYLHRSHHVIRI